ncbi:MAG TPA: DUF2752 domain-containing protein [Spirochaetota bacterium]|nr:DUF2752 domain-containing protein [Spirochaetota bacterium]
MAVVILAGAIGGDTFCFFKLVYGVPCPGCGMMRAFAALAGGDLAAALLFHPLVLVVPFLVLVAVFRKSRPFWAMYNSSAFWAACAACFMVVWAVRMFMFFPDFPPMDYSRSSLAWRAVELLCN